MNIFSLDDPMTLLYPDKGIYHADNFLYAVAVTLLETMY